MKWFSICRAFLVWVDFLQNDDEVLIILHMRLMTMKEKYDDNQPMSRQYVIME